MKSYKPPSRFMEWLSRLPFPQAWGMLRKYNPDHDMFLRNALTLNMIQLDYYGGAPDYSRINTYHVKLGNSFDVWIENYPYGYGRVRKDFGHHRSADFPGRPSWGTIRLLRQRVEQLIKEAEQNFYYGE